MDIVADDVESTALDKTSSDASIGTNASPERLEVEALGTRCWCQGGVGVDGELT